MKDKMLLIDANALKKYMCKICNDDYSDEPCEPSDCVFCNAIKNAEVIDAAPIIHAHWIIEKWPSGWIKSDSCSNCGNSPKDPYEPSKYCDKCGAKMDGDVEEIQTTRRHFTFYPLVSEQTEDDEVDLYLEAEELLEYDKNTGSIKVDKNIFDDFVLNGIIHICFVDSKEDDDLVIEYVMVSEDDKGIYMEYLSSWNRNS